MAGFRPPRRSPRRPRALSTHGSFGAGPLRWMSSTNRRRASASGSMFGRGSMGWVGSVGDAVVNTETVRRNGGEVGRFRTGRSRLVRSEPGRSPQQVVRTQPTTKARIGRGRTGAPEVFTGGRRHAQEWCQSPAGGRRAELRHPRRGGPVRACARNARARSARPQAVFLDEADEHVPAGQVEGTPG